MSSIPRDREKNGGALDFHLPSQHWGGRDMQILGLPGQQASPTSQVTNQEDLHFEKTSKVDGRTAAEVSPWSPDLCAHTITHMCISTHRHR